MDRANAEPQRWREDINRGVFTGRLARSPEFYRRDGLAVCDLLVGCVRTRTHEGQLVKKTVYIQVKAVAAEAERCCQELRKGALVTVHGELDSFEHRTADGEQRTTLGVVAHQVTSADRSDTWGQRSASRNAPRARASLAGAVRTPAGAPRKPSRSTAAAQVRDSHAQG